MKYEINEHFDEQELDLNYQQQVAAEKYYDELCDLLEEQIEINRENAIYNDEYDSEYDNDYLMTTATYDEMLDYFTTAETPEHLQHEYHEEPIKTLYISGPVEETFYDTTPFSMEEPAEETEEQKELRIAAEKQRQLEEYAKNNKHNWTLSKELRGIKPKSKPKQSKSQKRKNRRRRFKINKNFPMKM